MIVVKWDLKTVEISSQELGRAYRLYAYSKKHNNCSRLTIFKTSYPLILQKQKSPLQKTGTCLFTPQSTNGSQHSAPTEVCCIVGQQWSTAHVSLHTRWAPNERLPARHSTKELTTSVMAQVRVSSGHRGRASANCYCCAFACLFDVLSFVKKQIILLCVYVSLCARLCVCVCAYVCAFFSLTVGMYIIMSAAVLVFCFCFYIYRSDQYVNFIRYQFYSGSYQFP